MLVGLFYVFAIWIGFEVYALYEILQKYLAPKIAGPVIICASLLARQFSWRHKTGMITIVLKVHRFSYG
jgi:hypothetical protein